jgi:hypothetical protein
MLRASGARCVLSAQGVVRRARSQYLPRAVLSRLVLVTESGWHYSSCTKYIEEIRRKAREEVRLVVGGRPTVAHVTRQPPCRTTTTTRTKTGSGEIGKPYLADTVTKLLNIL